MFGRFPPFTLMEEWIVFFSSMDSLAGRRRGYCVWVGTVLEFKCRESYHLLQIWNICVLCCCLHVLFSSTSIAYKNEMQLLATFVGGNRLCLVFVGGRYGE